jgi:hypothetical protein
MLRCLTLALFASLALGGALVLALAVGERPPSACLGPKQIRFGDASYTITSRDVGEARYFDLVRDGQVEYSLAGTMDLCDPPYLMRITDQRTGRPRLVIDNCGHYRLVDGRDGVFDDRFIDRPAELRGGADRLPSCTEDAPSGRSWTITSAIVLLVAASVPCAIAAGICGLARLRGRVESVRWPG